LGDEEEVQSKYLEILETGWHPIEDVGNVREDEAFYDADYDIRKDEGCQECMKRNALVMQTVKGK
jgi:hypothetical protein